jgi:hypothetical protein
MLATGEEIGFRKAKYGKTKIVKDLKWELELLESERKWAIIIDDYDSTKIDKKIKDTKEKIYDLTIKDTKKYNKYLEIMKTMGW